MSRKYKFHNPESLYFITFAVHGWVDVFTRPAYKDILVDNLAYCQKHKGLHIYAWCIMTNHVHLVASAEGQFSLSDILRDYKKFTSKAIRAAVENNPKESRKGWLLDQFQTLNGFRFWRGDNHPIEIWSNSVIEQKIDYIHMNPVVAGIVFSPEGYMYSSAIDYMPLGNRQQSGLLKVEVCF